MRKSSSYVLVDTHSSVPDAPWVDDAEDGHSDGEGQWG